MKITKIVLSSVLAVGMLSAASNSGYEVGISYGLNSLDQTDFQDHSLQATIGFKNLSFVNSKIVPRIDFEYVSVDEDKLPQVENIYRLSVNGVYDFSSSSSSSLVPYALGGIGYELLDEEQSSVDFTDSSFAQLGLGVKYLVSDALSLKLEAKGLSAFGEGTEFQLYAGVVVPFGGASSVVSVDEDIVVLVDTNEPEIEANLIATAPVQEVIVADSDSDGIVDSEDNCVNTPSSYVNQVDASGCVAEFRLKVNFNANKYNIKSKYSNDIAKFAKYLQDFPKYNAQIKGHASTDLTTHIGVKLSENRANSVKNSLINLGVNSNRLKTIGVGGYESIASNKTESGKSENRRVEVKIFVP